MREEERGGEVFRIWVRGVKRFGDGSVKGVCVRLLLLNC